MISECTETEGPGKRFCIWLQGCNIGCKNCINDQMLSFEPKNILSVKNLINYISSSNEKYNLEGITFLGGEPFLQSKGLVFIARFCKEIGLSVISFSGFEYEKINNNVVEGSKEFLSELDVLIDGAYVDTLEDSDRNWVGSTNQNFNYLTERYTRSIELDMKYKNKIEINFNKDSITINGESVIIKRLKKYK